MSARGSGRCALGLCAIVPVPPSCPVSSGSIALAKGWERWGRLPTTAISNSPLTALASRSPSPTVPAPLATSGSTTSPSGAANSVHLGSGRRELADLVARRRARLLNSFARNRLSLLEAQSTGAAERVSLLEGDEGKWPVSWSPDGRYVLYVTNNDRTSNDIWVLLRDGTGSPYPYLHTAASENWASFSPDGRWVVFSATESGQSEVFVAPFPAPVRRWRVSADGGSQARWRRDGKEIFYVAPNRMLMSVSVTTIKGRVEVGSREPLFELQHPYGAYHAFDVTADGQRFLVNTLVVNPKQPGVIAHCAESRRLSRIAEDLNVVRSPVGAARHGRAEFASVRD